MAGIPLGCDCISLMPVSLWCRVVEIVIPREGFRACGFRVLVVFGLDGLTFRIRSYNHTTSVPVTMTTPIFSMAFYQQ